MERDTELLNDLGVDHLFAPTQMYGTNHVCYVEPEVGLFYCFVCCRPMFEMSFRIDQI